VAADEATVTLPTDHLEAQGDRLQTSVGNTTGTNETDNTNTTAQRPETPSTQEPQSEDASSTSPTTPSSAHPANTSTGASATPTNVLKPVARPAVPALPAVPIIPAIPKASSKDPKPAADKVTQEEKSGEAAKLPVELSSATSDTTVVGAAAEETDEAAIIAPVKTAPKSWANLFTSAAPIAKPTATQNGADSNGATATQGGAVADGSTASGDLAIFAKSNANSVAEALHAYRVGGGEKVAFVEPRGLINTGNMCYMNSVSTGSGCWYHLFTTNGVIRFCKFLFSVYLFMTSWIKSARKLRTALRARRR
jgi:ubiquitin carboxyl-terminal hydrolase 10